MSKLKINFFQRPTLIVAKELLGAILIRKINSQKLSGIIVETEGYIGPDDLASHASRGRTVRTEIMFGPAGQAYIYLIYGMYYCLNVVTEKENFPAAVLIRAVEPISGLKLMAKNRKIPLNLYQKPKQKDLFKLASGPGKLCQAFLIDKTLNGENICQSKKLYIEKSKKVKDSDIIATKRIGVDYADKYKDKKWRFYLKDNNFVSKKEGSK